MGQGDDLNGCDSFPEKVRCSTADVPANVLVEDWQTVSEVFAIFGLGDRRYVTLSLPDESYVQCLGNKLRLVVEVRRYNGGEGFTHWIVGGGELTGIETAVGDEAGAVVVDESQVLTIRDARQIIKRFLFHRDIPDKYTAQDVTDQFM